MNRRPLRMARLSPVAAAVLTLVVLLGATAAAVRWRAAEARSGEAEQLEALTSETTARIASSLSRYADLLTSLSAFQRQDDRSIGAYESYVGSIGLDAHPGIATTAYIARVSGPSELAALVDERRRAGQPEFSAKVGGDATGPHAVVAYAVPDGTGIAGVDLAGDPVRWSALRRAADQATPVVTTSADVPEEWGLVGPYDSSLQVYAPVYRQGASITSVYERRQALIGWTGLSVDLRDVLDSLALDEGVLDIALLDAATGELVDESRSGAAERIAGLPDPGSEVIDAGGLPIEVRSAFPPDARPDEGVPLIAVSGGVAALTAAYGVYASLRFRRALLDRAEAQRRRAELMTSRFHAAVDDAPVGVVIVGFDGTVEVANPRLRELMRVPEGEGVSVFEHFLPEDRDDVLANMATLVSGEADHLVVDRQLRRSDGSLIWCRIHSSLLRGDDGTPTAIVGHVQDIEAERAAEEELRSRTRWFSSIVEQSSDLITLFDADGVITWVSPSVAELLGRRPDELLGMRVMTLVHPGDRARVAEALARVRAGLPAREEYRVLNGDGEWIWLESTASDLLDDPDVRAMIATSRDVTERHRATERLAHQAAHDPLTGLANRSQLEDRLDAALEEAVSAGGSVAVAYLDLDGFKAVNDTYGHGAGDELLKVAAEVLRDEVRRGDLIARIGGDEFVVVLRGADLTAAVATAERIRLRLSEPLELPGVRAAVRVSVSVGVALANAGDSVASVLRGADAALYRAKGRGRDRIEISSHDVGVELGQPTPR